MASREEVYAAIDSERNYQDAAKGNAAGPRDPHSLGSIIVFMETYLGKVKSAYSGPWPDGVPPEQALQELRKVVALGVYGMELHGAPQRQ